MYSETKIPYKSSDPRYARVWNMIRKQGMTLEAALAKIDQDKATPAVRKETRVQGEVTYTIKADTTQATQAVQELRDQVQDLQTKVETCTQALARAMNVKPEGGINPLEALFYIADLQKEILAELKAIRANTQPTGKDATEKKIALMKEALHQGGP